MITLHHMGHLASVAFIYRTGSVIASTNLSMLYTMFVCLLRTSYKTTDWILKNILPEKYLGTELTYSRVVTVLVGTATGPGFKPRPGHL